MSIARTGDRERGLNVTALTLLITLSGIAFNAARMLLRLDQGPWLASLAAFALLGAGAVALARRTGLDSAELGVVRPRALPALAGGTLAAAVLIGSAALSAPVLHLPSWTQFAQGLI